ncbi:MAG: MFS transporter [Dehalococcoidia bacterium]|nr:MFS transporter [Dehalococcoidia bacterium]
MTRRHDPFSAVRQPNFALYALSLVLSSVGATSLQAAVAWQVYDVSRSTLQLGVLGLVQFAPSLFMTLVAGAVADSYDRKRVVLLAKGGLLAAITTLTVVSAGGPPGLPAVYALVLGVALASAFETPARQALVPSLVTAETFPHAITTSSTIQQLGFVSGPALAGLLISLRGVAAAYLLASILTAGSLAAVSLLRPRPDGRSRRGVTLGSIKEGVQFVWRRQVLLGAMTLDMFAVIFGGASALLPVYAKDIPHVGARGYGLLAASLDLGAVLMSFGLVFLPPVKRTGRALLIAVACFGLATMLFGVSRSFPLSLAAYMAVGMADQVSVVMRQTTIQLATPDALRGRVSAVNMLFIGASNRLGAVESGFVAAATSATFAVVSGGAGCLAVFGLVAAKMPELRAYRIVAHSALTSGAETGTAERGEDLARSGAD